MNRTDRLLSIMMELQEKPWPRAADMAELFEVSTRTIYRDIQALEEAGVPVEGRPGKGYNLPEDYLLAPLLFTTDEAVILKLGSDYLARHFDASYRSAARSASLKVQAVLPEAVQGVVEALQESIHFVPVNAFDNPAEQARLKVLREALLNARTLAYATPDGTAHRIDPYGLVHLGSQWNLLGLHHDTGRVQHIKVAHLTELWLTDDTFERPAAYRAVADPLGEARHLTVRVRFDAEVAHWVQAIPTFYVESTETIPEGVEVTLRVQREAEVLPWLLSWGHHARVLEPPSLRARLAHEIALMAERYRPQTTLLP